MRDPGFKSQTLSAGGNFEKRITISDPSVLAFAFDVEDGMSVEFSVLLERISSQYPYSFAHVDLLLSHC